MIDTTYDLCVSLQCLQRCFPQNQIRVVFFPLSNVLVISPKEALRKTVFRFARADAGRHVHGLPPNPIIPFAFVVRERLSTSNQNGGYHEHVLLRTNFV